MTVVILAGGMGTRLAPYTDDRPKPMVEVGGRPMLWHIMQHFDRFGLREFVVALGHKGHLIKDYFLNYRALSGDVSVSLARGDVRFAAGACEDWHIHLIDTGEQTATGGRLRRLRGRLDTGPFLMTYGDGVSDLDVGDLIRFHRRMGRWATVSAARPPGRFGHMTLRGDLVSDFREKPQMEEGWINAGFFVLEPRVLDLIAGDATVWERDPLEHLARMGQLAVYRHEGFWQCVDTPRDLNYLESLWQRDAAPWRNRPQTTGFHEHTQQVSACASS